MKKKFDGYVILSDLDGTLLNNEKMVSKENKKAIDYFIDNGGRFSIATGRPFEASEEYVQDVKMDLPMIVYNGGMIYDYNNKSIVSEKLINEKQKNILDKIIACHEKIGIEIYSRNYLFVYKDVGISERVATRKLDIVYDMPENLFSMPWNKVLLVGDEKDIDELEKTYEFRDEVDIVRSAKICCEILPLNSNKGQALKDLIHICNLDAEKVIAVGDNMNDFEFLQASRLPFCPENANDEIKKIVKHITVDNEHHVIEGIVKWIEDNK